MDEVKEAAKDAAASARDTIEKGYEGAREFTSAGLEYAEEISDSLTDFAKRQPWVALAGAFLIGYVMARALRQLSL